MIVIELLIGLWIFTGIYFWIKMPNQEFGVFDFVVGLPLTIIFWPRIKTHQKEQGE